MIGPIGVIDYGLGNLRSVAGAIEKLGFEPLVSRDPAQLESAAKLILPGVGAFGDGMRNLTARGLLDPLRDLVLERNRPILGICLGAELMAHDSDEFGMHQGLGWVDARVRRMSPADSALRVPHVGWNEVRQTADDAMFAEVPDGALFYFVHSYQILVDDPSLLRGVVNYGGVITAAFRRGHIWGTQFHPEKSQRHGLTVLGNFLRA